MSDYVVRFGSETALPVYSKDEADDAFLLLDGTNSGDVTADLELFKNTTVSNSTDGKALYVYRKSTSEGTDYIKFYIDQYEYAHLTVVDGGVSASYLYLDLVGSGDIIFKAAAVLSTITTNRNGLLLQAGNGPLETWDTTVSGSDGSSYHGGNTIIRGGNGNGTNSDGGDVTLYGGVNTGSGDPGRVIITGPVDWNGITGDVDFGSNIITATSFTETTPTLFKLDQTTPQSVTPLAGTAFAIGSHDFAPNVAPGAFVFPTINFTNSNSLGFSPYYGGIQGGLFAYAHETDPSTGNLWDPVIGCVYDFETGEAFLMSYSHTNLRAQLQINGSDAYFHFTNYEVSEGIEIPLLGGEQSGGGTILGIAGGMYIVGPSPGLGFFDTDTNQVVSLTLDNDDPDVPQFSAYGTFKVGLLGGALGQSVDMLVTQVPYIGRAEDERNGTIVHFTDNGDGKTKVESSTIHGMGTWYVIIADTTNYNGTWKIEQVSGEFFVIDTPYVADDATGTWTSIPDTQNWVVQSHRSGGLLGTIFDIAEWRYIPTDTTESNYSGRLEGWSAATGGDGLTQWLAVTDGGGSIQIGDISGGNYWNTSVLDFGAFGAMPLLSATGTFALGTTIGAIADYLIIYDNSNSGYATLAFAANGLTGTCSLQYDGTHLNSDIDIVPSGAYNLGSSDDPWSVLYVSEIAIGANTLDTNEWAFLDGQDQTVATTSAVQFASESIVGASDATLFSVTANATQTSDIFQILDNDGTTEKMDFTDAGQLGIYIPSIGATFTGTAGILLQNPTASTSGANNKHPPR